MQIIPADNAKHAPQQLSVPLWTSPEVRILHFALSPGEEIAPHAARQRLGIVVLSGEGYFTGGEGERLVGPHTLLLFEPGEVHAVRALAAPLTFMAFLWESEGESKAPRQPGRELPVQP